MLGLASFTWVSSSSSSDEESEEEQEDEESEEDEEPEEELLDFGISGTFSNIFRGRPLGLFPFLRSRSSFSCSFLLNAASSLGSRMFSCGSQLLCLKEATF